MSRLERRGKGRDDYPVRPMWNSVIAGIVYQHPSAESLRRELRRNGELRQLCGFDPFLGEKAVPTKDAFSRFLESLIEQAVFITEMFHALVDELKKKLPDLGVKTAVDSKAIQSCAGRVTGGIHQITASTNHRPTRAPISAPFETPAVALLRLGSSRTRNLLAPINHGALLPPIDLLRNRYNANSPLFAQLRPLVPADAMTYCLDSMQRSFAIFDRGSRFVLRHGRAWSIVAIFLSGCATGRSGIERRTGAMLGSADAPIEVVVFSDFECPVCKRTAAELNRIHKRRPNRVKIYFKHFPLSYHPQALNAAAAAEAALSHGKFWQMHDLIFQNSGELSDGIYAELASKIGLDPDLFRNEMKSEEVKRRVAKDRVEGEAVGVNGVPFFLINRVPFRGSYADLEERLDGLEGTR